MDHVEKSIGKFECLAFENNLPFKHILLCSFLSLLVSFQGYYSSLLTPFPDLPSVVVVSAQQNRRNPLKTHIKLTLYSTRSQRIPPLGVPIWSTRMHMSYPGLFWHAGAQAIALISDIVTFFPADQHWTSFPLPLVSAQRTAYGVLLGSSLLSSIMYYSICEMSLIFLCTPPTEVQVSRGQGERLMPVFHYNLIGHLLSVEKL